MTDLTEEGVLKRQIAGHLDACSYCRESLATRGRTPACKTGHDLSMGWLRMRVKKKDPYAQQLLDIIEKNKQTARRDD